MKPLNIDKSGCSNTSSNCVVWQGPNIECIDLCKGDSITEVVYKLAVELCTIMDTFDLNNYDLKCFAGGACKPTDFKEFIQLVINKICYVQSCSGCLNSCDPCDTTSPSTNVPVVTTPSNPIVPIAPAFYYTNPQGDLVTTMPVDTYTVTIGNRVSNIVSEILTINATLVNHNIRITALELAPPPVFVLPDITPVCVLPSSPTPINVVLASLEQQFCELRIATGTPNNIFTALGRQPVGLGSAPALANPLTIMSALPGFVSNIQNEADSISNLWVTISDMRLAIQNIITNYLPSDCSGIDLTILATYAAPNVTIYINGTIPGTFVNTFPAGTLFTISDTFGASTQFNINIPTILNTLGGFIFDISTTPLNPASNLFINASPSFTSTTTGSQCQSLLNYTIQNQANCAVVTYNTTTPAQIDYSYTTAAITANYSIEIWDALTNTFLGGFGVANTIVQVVTGSFLSTFPITSLTQYKLRLVVTVNGIPTYCDFTLVTTT
jgi:hypothetical protein